MSASGILKPGKSPGPDNVTNEMIASTLYFPDIFLYLFNCILQNGGSIPLWSQSMIVPIFKKGSLDDPSNYRGISLISCLAKVFYSILNNRLLKYCLENKILSHNQLFFFTRE